MSRVRFRKDVGWEMRCDDCAARRGGAYWPLGSEFWDTHNLARCRACARDRKNAYERQSSTKRVYLRTYRATSKDAIAIKNRLYYEANRERLNAYNRAYREQNRDRILTQQRARYERQKAA